MIISIFHWIINTSFSLGYLGIFILMIIESSILPMPSEIVIPPAAYLASQGRMNVTLVVLVGLLGSLVGATINYLIGYVLGRIVVYELAHTKWAKLLFISPQKIERAEKYFLRNANSATFWGRLIPVIRQLVSLPAGFFEMNYWSFLLWTTLGSGIWIIILAILGYALGANQALLHQYYRGISVVLLFLGASFLYWRIHRRRKLRMEIKKN